jgi:hypothetical protein
LLNSMGWGWARKKLGPEIFQKVVLPILTPATENNPRSLALSLFNQFSLLLGSSQSSVTAPLIDTPHTAASWEKESSNG